MFSVDVVNVFIALVGKPAIVLMIASYLVRVAPNVCASKHHLTLFIATLSPLVFLLGFFGVPALLVPITPISLAPYHQAYFEFSLLTYGFLAIYLIGVFIGVFYFLHGLADVYALSSEATKVKDTELLDVLHTLKHRLQLVTKTHLLVSDKISSPIVWGVIRPTILLPKNYKHWSSDTVERALCHELAHVKRGDWGIKVILHGVCCVFWFLPPVCSMAKKCLEYAEMACDDYVVKTLGNRAGYAQDLMNFAARTETKHEAKAVATCKVAVLNLMENTQLFLRIEAILDGAKPRDAMTSLRKATYLVIAGLIFIALSSVQFSKVQSGAFHNKVYPLKFYPSWNQFNAPKPIQAETVIALDDLKKFFSPQLTPNTYETMKVTASFADVQHALNQNNAKQYDVSFNEKSLLAEIKNTSELGIPSEISVQGYIPLALVSPKYPEIALKRRIEGRVVVSFDIATDGLPFNIKIEGRGPHRSLTIAAKEAIARSVYKPLTIDGHKIITTNAKVAFSFTLTDS